jgi:hypothetical protein
MSDLSDFRPSFPRFLHVRMCVNVHSAKTSSYDLEKKFPAWRGRLRQVRHERHWPISQMTAADDFRLYLLYKAEQRPLQGTARGIRCR